MHRFHFHSLHAWTLAGVAVICVGLWTQNTKAAEVRTVKDLEYATVGEHRLLLDLYLQPKPVNAPLIVWVHGGAWRSGSKKDVPISPLFEHGWSIASVGYRLTPVAPFPANVHDIKAAIRFLRANAAEYGFNSRKLVIAGASAGGHLAALVGVSNGHEELEGKVGLHLDQFSDVQAIVSLYGASNLETILSQSTPHGLSVRVPALELLLGGQPEDKPALARLASPVRHVDANDPPLMLIHGDQDPQMPINQSHELHGAYVTAGLNVRFVVVHGEAHGGKAFYDKERIRLIDGFLKANLKQ